MKILSRRAILASALLVGLLPTNALFAADKPKELSASTGRPTTRCRCCSRTKAGSRRNSPRTASRSVWVQTLGSNKALEFLNAGSIDFGSTAGSAALLAKINGNPIKSIYVYSKPEWTALVTRKDTNIKTVADLKGKRVAVTRGTDPHIFLVRALQKAGLSEKDITPVLLQHPDGATALIRGDVDAWAGLDPMMAQAELRDGARLFYRDADANTWGILNVREDFAKEHPDLVKRVLAVYEKARKYALAHPDELEKSFIAATKLPKDVVEKQLREAHRSVQRQDRQGAARQHPRGRDRAAAGGRDQGRTSM